MKRKIGIFHYGIVFLFCFSLLTLAADLTLLTPQKVVFRDILAGDTLRYEIRLKNEGESIVNVHKIISSCKCTVLTFKATKLKPGDSLKIPVIIDTEGFWGTTLRTIQILSNDPNQPKITVLFEIHVKNELEFSPRFIDLQDVAVGEQVVRNVALKNNASNPIVIEAIETDEERIHLKWQKTTLMPGDSCILSITFKPEKTFSSYSIIYIHTQGGRVPLHKIPVYLNVKE